MTTSEPAASEPSVSGSAHAARGPAGASAESASGLPTAGFTAEFAARVPQLLQAMRSIGSGLELRSTLDRLCETAATLTAAQYTAIGVVDEAGDGFTEFVTYGTVRNPEGERVGVPIRVQGQVFGRLYLAERRGGGAFGEHDLQMVRVLAAAAGVAIGNARLYEAARQRERWIDGSVAVTTALLSGNEGTDPLNVVAEQARRLADAASGVVLLTTPDGGLEVVAVSARIPSSKMGAVVPPASPLVKALLGGEPVFLDDATTEPRSVTRLGEGFGPVMLLPLDSGRGVLGALATPRTRGAPRFTETERILGTQFASQAALALMMAEAQRDRERLAVLEDRDRIARDLHDVVIQRLFATGMMLEGGRSGRSGATAAGPAEGIAEFVVAPEVRDGIAKAIDELDVTIQEIRTAVFALQQTPAEEPAGLRVRVEREAKMASVPLGFMPTCRFVGPIDTAVGEATAKNMIAALREALSNAFRHAHATRIDVLVDATARLRDGTGAVLLSVADDGVGIPETGRRSGLRNLSRRAEALGGSSTVQQGIGEDGRGTCVLWQAPLDPRPL